MCWFSFWNSVAEMPLFNAGLSCPPVFWRTLLGISRHFSHPCLCTPGGFTSWETCSTCGSLEIMLKTVWDTGCSLSFIFYVGWAPLSPNWHLAWARAFRTLELPERLLVCWVHIL